MKFTKCKKLNQSLRRWGVISIFEQILKQSKDHDKILENIDIGGPTMVRAAAKNYNDVTVITSTKQYSELINELKLLIICSYAIKICSPFELKKII